jgi:iron only hydrogenase large subunit-like protein/uncharacterized Fe-S cluster-containing protein
MTIINFSKTNCQNCYACVRSCPVKAIRVTEGQAEIVESHCIACGLCLRVCPKNAKQIMSESERVKALLKQSRVAVSLAPSYITAFGELGTKIVSYLKGLGFTYVEETVAGAKAVTDYYQIYKDEHGDTACITSACTSANLLVQKYYPNLIKHLIPVLSPMEMHARMLKQKYGQATKVVFIGPCLAKKIDGMNDLHIDAVMTFDDLYKWMKQSRFDLKELEEVAFDGGDPHYHHYPMVGGIASHFKKHPVIKVDGVEACMEALEAIQKGLFHECILEMSACKHGCMGGSAMPNDGVNVYERQLRLEQYKPDLKFYQQNSFDYNLKTHKQFYDLSPQINQPTDVELKSILNKMGKHNQWDELNCGTCGYNTCQEKAIAIYNDMAEISMCLPFLQQKAETFANVLFDMTPNSVLIVDEDLNIIDLNPAGETLFNLNKSKSMGLPVSMVLNANLFEQVKRTKQNYVSKKVWINQNQNCVILSIVWVEYHRVLLCILHDITDEIKKEEHMMHLRSHTIEMAQEVINKQMRVAQEIASLLGETTAETKVTLTKLKVLIQKDEVDSE